MRLINTATIRLEEFNESEAPPYAILSHTWGNQEVTFQEIQAHQDEPPIWKRGYLKIVETCRLARDSGISYAWVDTCCIDKTSSAELSEAINSMFRWYEKASICYAFLSDIHVPPGTDLTQLTKSRWFTRGWTLQELIAPGRLVFYNSDWEVLATRDQIRDRISEGTGICASYLSYNTQDIQRRLSVASIAQRMSWAAKRQTTRTEDIAYCLLGILGINMPLLYGEGEQAFIRLQEEIIRHTNDHSIFAWNLSPPRAQGYTLVNDPADHAGMLAPTPRAFVGSGNVVSIETGEDSTPFFLTNRGIQINMRIFREGSSIYGILHCRDGHAASLIAVPLAEFPGSLFRRSLTRRCKWVMHEEWNELTSISVYLSTTPVLFQKYQIPFDSFLIQPLPDGASWRSISPGYTYDPASHVITPEEGLQGPITRDRNLKVSFWLDSKAKKVVLRDTLTLDITIRPLYANIWGSQSTYTYSITQEGTSRSYPSVTSNWFASVEKKKVFGRSVRVIEIFSPSPQAATFVLEDSSVLAQPIDTLYSASQHFGNTTLPWIRMWRQNILYWGFVQPIDRLAATEIFRHSALIFEFACVRPLIAVIFALLMWNPAAVETWWQSHSPRQNPSILMLLLHLLTDGRLVPVWASSLALLSFFRELKIAPRNAKIAGLYFCGHLLAAFFVTNMKWVLFWGVVASGWAFPVGERYYHLKGSVRGYGKHI